MSGSNVRTLQDYNKEEQQKPTAKPNNRGGQTLNGSSGQQGSPPGTPNAALEQPASTASPRNDSSLQQNRHKYNNIEAGDEAQSAQGDAVTNDYTGQFSTQGNSYDNIKTTGKAKSQNGNMYGKSVFD